MVATVVRVCSFLSAVIPKEHKDLEMEQNYWQQRPSQGQFVHWPIIGSLVGTRCLPYAWAVSVPDDGGVCVWMVT